MRAVFLAVLLSGCTTINNNTTVITAQDGAIGDGAIIHVDLARSADFSSASDLASGIDLATVIANDMATGSDAAMCVPPGGACPGGDPLYCCLHAAGSMIMSNAALCDSGNDCRQIWIWNDPNCPVNDMGQREIRSCYNVGSGDHCGACQ